MPRIVWVPEAISQFRSFVMSLIDDGVKTFQLWKNWKNSTQAPAVSPSTELRVKCTITNPDVRLAMLLLKTNGTITDLFIGGSVR